MMAAAHENAAPVAGTRPPSELAPYTNGLVRLGIAAIAIAGAMLATNNWCFVTLPAVVTALIIDYGICTWRRWIALRLVLAAVVGVGIGISLRIGPEWAFRAAFGIEPPAGVRDARIWRHYVGGPGEHVLIIEFTADRNAVKKLSKLYPEPPVNKRIEAWEAGGSTWPGAFDTFVDHDTTALARRSWLKIKPLKEPDVYDFGSVRQVAGYLTLFHEPRTNRCVALHVRF